MVGQSEPSLGCAAVGRACTCALPGPPPHRGASAPPPGDDALPNGLDVTFEVTELRRLTGSYNTMVGNNEGSMVRLGPRPAPVPASS